MDYRQPVKSRATFVAKDPIRTGGYSDFKLSTGFAVAARIAWKLTVNNAINIDPAAAIKKTRPHGRDSKVTHGFMIE